MEIQKYLILVLTVSGIQYKNDQLHNIESLSCVRLFSTPWRAARQAPLSMELLQARTLQWVDMPSSRGSSQPRDQTQVSRVAGGLFTIWATREA